jgi:hypothetical protein
MFHFPTFPPHALCVQARVTPHDWCGVPPFGHPRINARLAAPRGLSQPPTSFIGSWCPGIHRVPLTTWPHNYNNPHTPHHRTDPHPRRDERAGTDRRGARACNQRKMLASTVQFSTTNPRSPRRPHRTPTPTGDAAMCDQENPDRDNTPHPRLRTGRGIRSLRTQQRAYHRPRATTPFPTRTGAGRTSSDPQTTGRTGQRSTLEHHPSNPRPPGTGHHHVLGAALHHHTPAGTAASAP